MTNNKRVITSLYIDPHVWKEFKLICVKEERQFSLTLEAILNNYIKIKKGHSF